MEKDLPRTLAFVMKMEWCGPDSTSRTTSVHSSKNRSFGWQAIGMEVVELSMEVDGVVRKRIGSSLSSMACLRMGLCFVPKT